MRCSKCGSDNPEDKRFCGDCGSPLGNRCSKCGADNPPGKRFCGDCGAALTAPAAAAIATLPRVPAAGERRHLTVLFCDLVGSTKIAARLDPEEWREIVADYHRAAAQAIERFGGHVAQYLGDGVMAYFGYPEAHANDAERAARAGLAILEDITRLNQHPSRSKLSVRVGIDSGAVVVGAGADQETDVFGEAPNIAARVQAAAAPDTVLISAATHRLVTGLFIVEDWGAHALKGVERPMQLYRVIQPAGVRGRLAAAAASRGLTPFVGREDELRMLTSRWQRVLDGEGQVVLIIGEPGIGKSRLVQQFHQQITGTEHTWVETAAAPFYQNTPFYPVTEALWQLVWEQSLNRFGDYLRELQNHSTFSPTLSHEIVGEGLRAESHREFAQTPEPGQPVEPRMDELQSGLISAGLKPAEAIPLIAPLLHLPLSVQYTPSSLPPEQQRRRLLATLIEWLLGAARAQPLVIVIEDLHWADPSTLELIQLLTEQGATARMLVLCTARPEFRIEGPLRAHHTQITLNRLSARNVREMIAQVAARNALATETLDAVVERTSGVPLFVEELTRAVLESGNSRLSGREIPVTLHDSLMARLDRLGSAKEVLQIGSVIGSEFSYELLRAVHSLDDDDLQRELRRLTDADLLYVRGLVPDATYQFKHVLIRDAAYEALLKSRRKELHGQVARTIDEKFPLLKEAHPEVLARHWTEAGETAQAIAEWTRAGKAAKSHHAFKEAQQSYEQALTLLSLLPESAERDLQELDLRQSIIWILPITTGFSSPQSVDAQARAIALAKKSGNLSQLVSLMHHTGTAAWMAGDYESASTLADQALELAVREGNPTNLGLAYALQINLRHVRGDLAGAEVHFARALKFFEDATIWPFPIVRLDPFGVAIWNAWLLGRPDLARQRLARMMAAANQNNPAEVALSGCHGARSYLLLREYERAEMLAIRALELAEKHQMPQIAGVARFCLGWARAWLGHPSEGIALIRQAIAGLAAIGTHSDSLTMFLAESQALSGAIGDALETIEPVLQPNRPDANKAIQPEAFRLHGELQAKQGRREPAEADFRKALTLARTMGAKALELRAATSLARLLRDTGRRVEARRMLSEIYNWFTEGFDTADLKEAKALLDELAT